MTILFEVLAAVLVGSGITVLLAVQGATVLGRCISRDDEQREPPRRG